MATLTAITAATPASPTELNTRLEELNTAKPDKTAAESIAGVWQYPNGLGIGGVTKTAWPTAVAGSNGTVFYSGSITLNGPDGVTITHNRGSTDYLAKILPEEAAALARVGDIVVVRNANTAVVYNSGAARISARVELSVVA